MSAIAQIYRCDHLRVVLVSPPMSKKISCLESWGNENTFVGCGNEVLAWRRLTCLGSLGSHPGKVRFVVVVVALVIAAAAAPAAAVVRD